MTVARGAAEGKGDVKYHIKAPAFNSSLTIRKAQALMFSTMGAACESATHYRDQKYSRQTMCGLHIELMFWAGGIAFRRQPLETLVHGTVDCAACRRKRDTRDDMIETRS